MGKSAELKICDANEEEEEVNCATPSNKMALQQRTKIALLSLGGLKRPRKKKRKIIEEEQFLPIKLDPSNVYVEDPSDLSQKHEPFAMDIVDFWHFVYESRWRGRLRICEG